MVKKVKKREYYGFTSKELDEETGLYYFGARYYDAQISKWMSCDPIYDGIKEGLGVYTYCRNNPLIYKDPTGLESADAAYSRYIIIEENKIKARKATQESLKKALEKIKKNNEGNNPMGGKDVDGYNITQRFDENKYKSTWRHKGIDMQSKSRDVYSSGDGEIVYSGKDKYLGNVIVISHGDGKVSIYGHMSSDAIKTNKSGDTVKGGDLLGKYAKPTVGQSNGPHLHYQENIIKGYKGGKMTTDTVQGLTVKGYSSKTGEVNWEGGIKSVNPDFTY